MNYFNLIFLLTMYSIGRVSCGNFNDSERLFNDLLTNYNVNIRPVENQSQPLNVSVQAFISSIREFDEIQEMISYILSILVTWHDINMVWNPPEYGEIREVIVPVGSVWIPELILLTPAEDVDTLSKKWNKVRYKSDGQAYWMPVVLVESTCSVNVRMYPFDTQKCKTAFNVMNYFDSEVRLYVSSDKIGLSIYEDGLLWKLVDTILLQTNTGGSSSIDLILVLERKPTFIIINVILPILFLSLLNAVVFLLVPDSGERVSYTITVLLSIAVFMTIVSDLLPRSSDPVPIISYKLMVDMIISSLIVLVTVVNLQLYHTEDFVAVPVWVQSVHHALSCSGVKRTNNIKVNVTPGEPGTLESKELTTTALDAKGASEERNKNHVDARHIDKSITWKAISKLVDRIALITFTVASLGSFVIFMVVTTSSK